MEYVHLGKTGLRVSRVALGCMSFGEPQTGAHSWSLPKRESTEILSTALDLGINFFDTANIYSLGTSEEILGDFIAQNCLRDQTVIATKVYENMRRGPISGGLSRKAIFDEVDASLKRLKTDYIDLYIIHRWDYHTPVEETLEALHHLITAGKVRYIGASSMKAWQFVKAEYTADILGLTRFVSIQSHYNLIAREEEREMFSFCQDQGIGVTPWSPLARGRLAGSNRSARSQSDHVQNWLYESAKDSDGRIIEVVAALATERGCTMSQIALAWLLSKPFVTSPIVGATRPDQLVEIVDALKLKLAPSDIERLEEHYVPHLAPEYS